MVFVDTAFLLGLFNARDVLHRRAHAWAGSLDEPWLVTEYVLCETIDAFSAPIDRRKGHDIMSVVRSANDIQVVAGSTQLFDLGLRLHTARPDKRWSLTDCISFVVMSEHGIHRALAYDQDYVQAGFDALLRRDP